MVRRKVVELYYNSRIDNNGHIIDASPIELSEDDYYTLLQELHPLERFIREGVEGEPQILLIPCGVPGRYCEGIPVSLTQVHS